MTQSLFSFGYPEASFPAERRGAVYTRPWVVELVLDLAGYSPEMNLVDAVAIEPAAGQGAFLVPMTRRLVASCARQRRPLMDCLNSLVAYEIDSLSARRVESAVVSAIASFGVGGDVASGLAASWVKTGDFLFEAPHLREADFVVGNPPYIRLEDVPDELMRLYRGTYPTMRGRADLYVAFYEASLRRLKRGGVCAFICADRWMLNQYGADLREFMTAGFDVRTVVEMHNADAFDSEVSAYPAITVVRRGEQGRAVVASARAPLDGFNSRVLSAYLRSPEAVEGTRSPAEALESAVVDRWFRGPDPWPCQSPRRLATLRRIEEAFPALEDGGHARVGIGVATGCDEVFISRDNDLVEPSRLLPLAMASDTLSGTLKWSGHHLINPWDGGGLVELSRFPRLRDYFERHREALGRRHTARKNPAQWYRTIDRVNHPLTRRPKLLIPDIKDRFNPVLDRGTAYPHHNLYFICSDAWDLELLGGILLSDIGQFFIEAYGVRMRGGYLRFQAQYLRRIRVPAPNDIRESHAAKLIAAFRDRDRNLASEVALEIYGVGPDDLAS